jgi:hypothetical protein
MRLAFLSRARRLAEMVDAGLAAASTAAVEH